MGVTISGHQSPPSRVISGRVPGTRCVRRPLGRSITAVDWALPLFLDYCRRWQLHPALGGGRLTLNKGGPLDSFAARPARAGGGAVSDHDGYAIDIRYDILKADNREHMTHAENVAVGHLLADYNGAIAWGGPTAAASKANPGQSVGQYNHLIDEMHHYIAPGVNRTEALAVARKLGIRSDGTRNVNPAAALPYGGVRLRLGSKGPDVVALYKRFGLHTIDGLYRPDLASVVAAFQRRHPYLLAFDRSGTVGARTWKSLSPIVGATR